MIWYKKLVSFISQRQFSPQNNTEFIIDGIILFEKGRTEEAAAHFENYLMLADEYEVTHLAPLSSPMEQGALCELRYNLLTAKFTAMLCLSGMLSRAMRTDKLGQETKLGEFWMSEAENVFKKFKEHEEAADNHYMHPHLFYLYNKMKLISLQLNPESMTQLEQLYKHSLQIRKKCDYNNINCLRLCTLVDVMIMGLLARTSHRVQDAVVLATELLERLNKYKRSGTKYKAVYLFLGQVNWFFMELAHARNETSSVSEYAHLSLKNLRIGFNYEDAPSMFRLYQFLALSLITDDEDLNESTINKIESYFTKAFQGWKQLIQLAPNNRYHHRYHSLNIFYRYFMFKIGTSRERYATEVLSIFQKVFKTIMGSPELDNLEALETTFRVSFEQSRFSEILDYFTFFEKEQQLRKLPYSHGDILQVIRQLCRIKLLLSPFEIILHGDSVVQELENSLVSLSKSSTGKRDYWFKRGQSVYFKLLEVSGRLDKYESFRKKCKNFIDITSGDSLWYLAMNSNHSSLASLNEFIEVEASDINIISVKAINARDESISHELHGKVNNSVNQLENVFRAALGSSLGSFRVISCTNLREFISTVGDLEVIEPNKVNIITITHITDSQQSIVPTADIEKTLQNTHSKISWIMVDTISVQQRPPRLSVQPMREIVETPHTAPPPLSETLTFSSRSYPKSLHELVTKDQQSLLDCFNSVIEEYMEKSVVCIVAQDVGCEMQNQVSLSLHDYWFDEVVIGGSCCKKLAIQTVNFNINNEQDSESL